MDGRCTQSVGRGQDTGNYARHAGLEYKGYRLFYLETGLDPDYDSAGAQMVSVIANMGHLTIEDRTAIAAYLKALPPSN
ncbi:hypothetical protein [Nitrosomonas eutropha]|uniref:Uncharacterized protein n=2 Tax=Nitrosomonas eutropha TaxID=916 RepID=A0ABX5M518_9PROT|nr:hypothetical protein [Nitrosomonas eutropha]ABI58642.1 hypothetical protein Neut_0362 [Nitrosomonas eutropha C91]PXV74507.1 hypothetical protein C8R14_14416 [Nitrosomonas eutropha]